MTPNINVLNKPGRYAHPIRALPYSPGFYSFASIFLDQSLHGGIPAAEPDRRRRLGPCLLVRCLRVTHRVPRATQQFAHPLSHPPLVTLGHTFPRPVTVVRPGLQLTLHVLKQVECRDDHLTHAPVLGHVRLDQLHHVVQQQAIRKLQQHRPGPAADQIRQAERLGHLLEHLLDPPPQPVKAEQIHRAKRVGVHQVRQHDNVFLALAFQRQPPNPQFLLAHQSDLVGHLPPLVVACLHARFHREQVT